MRATPTTALSAAFFLLSMASTTAAALGDPDSTVTIYIHGYSGAGLNHDAPIGEELYSDDAAPLQELLGLPDNGDDPLAPNQIAGVEYMGNRLPDPDNSYFTWDDYWELDELFPPQGEAGVPLHAAVCAKFLRHVVERSGAQGANLLAVSFGGVVSRYMMANDVDGICSDGLVERWITLEAGVNGIWIAQNPIAQPILKFLDEDAIEIKHMSYHWMRDHVDPGQPPPNLRWSPPNWATSPSYRNTMIFHEISTDWSLFGGLMRKISHLTNDGEICAGDAQLAGVVEQYAWNHQQPMVQYLHAMHVPADPLPDHIGLEDHDGAWASIAAVLSGTRRATLRLVETTAHKIHEGPLHGKGELVFEIELFSRYAASEWGIQLPINNRNLRDGSAPMKRFGRGETRALDETLFDQMMLEEEQVIDAQITVRELDWSDMRNYRVFESLLHPNRLMLREWIQLDLDAPGPITVQTDEATLVFELDVIQFDTRDPQISDVDGAHFSGGTDLWWATDEPTRASVGVHGSDGSHFIVSGPQELSFEHQISVGGLEDGVRYELLPRGEDVARNLGQGALQVREAWISTEEGIALDN